MKVWSIFGFCYAIATEHAIKLWFIWRVVSDIQCQCFCVCFIIPMLHWVMNKQESASSNLEWDEKGERNMSVWTMRESEFLCECHDADMYLNFGCSCYGDLFTEYYMKKVWIWHQATLSYENTHIIDAVTNHSMVPIRPDIFKSRCFNGVAFFFSWKYINRSNDIWVLYTQ